KSVAQYWAEKVINLLSGHHMGNNLAFLTYIVNASMPGRSVMRNGRRDDPSVIGCRDYNHRRSRDTESNPAGDEVIQPPLTFFGISSAEDKNLMFVSKNEKMCRRMNTCGKYGICGVC
ncbi:MAG: hypothetical protein WCC86_09990, partial [Methanoregula sp.]